MPPAARASAAATAAPASAAVRRGSVGRSGERAIVAEARLFENAIDDPAAAAAAEDHRVRPFQDLDPVDVVEVAEVLDVVSNGIDEEIGGARIAAQDEGVAIALAGIVGCAGHEQEHVADRAQLLVLDLTG